MSLEFESHDSLDPSELNWLAFQYIAGELNEDDCKQFEKRMEEDQAAKEALAEVMEQTGTLRLLSRFDSQNETAAMSAMTKLASEPPVTRPFFNPLFWATLAAGIAICFAIFNLVRMDRMDQQMKQQVEKVEQKNSDVSQENSTKIDSIESAATLSVAQAWMDVLTFFEVESDRSEIGDSDFQNLIQEIESDIEVQEDTETAPMWMLAALSNDEANSDPMDPEEVQTP